MLFDVLRVGVVQVTDRDALFPLNRHSNVAAAAHPSRDLHDRRLRDEHPAPLRTDAWQALIVALREEARSNLDTPCLVIFCFRRPTTWEDRRLAIEASAGHVG